jgi:hypothetical protein
VDLVSQVVKLKNANVSVAAVNAGMRREILDETNLVPGNILLVRRQDPRLITRVILPADCTVAGFAMRLQTVF